MKYRDSLAILEASLPVVQKLYCWVNGISFDLEDSRQVDRKNAEALWNACTFNIERRGPP